MRSFTVGGVPAVLWSPGATDRPLIFIGHVGGQHKTAPEVQHLARRLVAAGFAVASADVPNHGDRPYDTELDRLAASTPLPVLQDLVSRQTVPEWRAVLDHVGADVAGYWGVSLGCGLGVPFVAAEPRVRAAVLGLSGGTVNAGTAAQIDVPVRFVVAWDDERVPRQDSLALYDAIGSADKTLHAHPGRHSDPLPEEELECQVAFFARHLIAH